jgi:amino-acid N-acetyltransferase
MIRSIAIGSDYEKQDTMIRKAKVQDIQAIKKLVEPYGKTGVMLPVSLSELYDRIRSFFLYEDESGTIVGVAALHVSWDDLAEIRSLAVAKDHKKKGIGRSLVERCLSDAVKLGVGRVFVLTYIPEFFSRVGFAEFDKARLPHKVWSECLKCGKFPECDETAMIRKIG